MFLITAKRKGVPLPETLPQSLLPGSQPPVTTNQHTFSPQQSHPSQHSQTPQHKQISDEDVKKYQEIFKRSDTKGENFVSGEQARQIFSRSGLNVTDLAKIW
jgi:hypothetical protein